MEFLGPLELIAMSYSLLMIIVAPLLPLDQWETLWFAKVPWANAEQSSHYFSLFLLQNRRMGSCHEHIYVFNFLLVPKLVCKSGNHKQQLKTWIFCCNPCWWKLFCFCFLRRWCDSNVMLFNIKYIQESLSSGWGEKTKLSRELSKFFSMKTTERTLFDSYCL